MTVSYSSTVATVRYNSFARLLLRWRGSVYKAVWPLLSVFCAAYITLALTYQFLPNETDSDRAVRRKFVQICAFAGHVSSAIPVSFVLGFFVSIVVDRWWQQFSNLPTPDSVCLLLSTYLTHQSKVSKTVDKTKCQERPLLFRRTIARYLNLSTALCFHSISLSMRRKVRTLDDLVLSGLMTTHEHQIYRQVAYENAYYFVPLVWSISLLTRAHYEGMIVHDRHLDSLVSAVVEYWNQLHTLFLFDYVNVPLVYNQVVTLVVYLYLAMLVLSQQFVDPKKLLQDYDNMVEKLHELNNATSATFNLQGSIYTLGGYGFIPSGDNSSNNLVGNQTLVVNGSLNDPQSALRSALSVSPNIPVFAVVSLICYAGWLRVAESHVFPFGEDDDDFEVLPLMDRNFNTSMWFVDTMMNPAAHPTLPQVDPTREPADKQEKPMDQLQLMSKIIFNQGAMGRKRTIGLPSQAGDRTLGMELPQIEISEPENQPIPNLPYPNALRRRESRYFFAGSINRIYGDEPHQTISDSPCLRSDSVSEPHPSLLTFRSSQPRAPSLSTRWMGSLGSIFGHSNPRGSRFGWIQRPFNSARGIEQPDLGDGDSKRGRLGSLTSPSCYKQKSFSDCNQQSNGPNR